jgi:hypothetical protein
MNSVAMRDRTQRTAASSYVPRKPIAELKTAVDKIESEVPVCKAGVLLGYIQSAYEMLHGTKSMYRTDMQGLGGRVERD